MAKETKKENTKNSEKKLQTIKGEQALVYAAVGRRRESTARVKLFVVPTGQVQLKNLILKKGEIAVNGRKIHEYFPGKVFRKLYEKPFTLTDSAGRFAVSAVISGGGLRGQLDAFTHGVSRALLKTEPDGKIRPLLKQDNLLSRDDRTKQRRKAGFAQKARARKQSPKR